MINQLRVLRRLCLCLYSLGLDSCYRTAQMAASVSYPHSHRAPSQNTHTHTHTHAHTHTHTHRAACTAARQAEETQTNKQTDRLLTWMSSSWKSASVCSAWSAPCWCVLGTATNTYKHLTSAPGRPLLTAALTACHTHKHPEKHTHSVLELF